MDITSIATGAGLTTLGLFLAPIVTRIVPKADAYVRTEGALIGGSIAHFAENAAPAGLRDFVKSELVALASAQGENAQVTVTDAVDKILVGAKVKFPGVTTEQVAQIAGDFVYAVAAGIRTAA